jgi:predicted metal-dependent phosphoesterase TrpH
MVEYMDMEIIEYQRLLNDNHPEKRLDNLKYILENEKNRHLPEAKKDYYINNHIHTTFSFSYYTPAMAIWMALRSGLQTAGIMDHDTISGAAEFKAAGKLAGVHTTKGVECRVDFSKTPLYGRCINNPDQKSVAYVALHGVPDSQVRKVDEFFTPYREKRNERNMLMVERLNKLVKPFSLYLDYRSDILPLSLYYKGGTVTERHIVFALARKILARFSKGKQVIDFLKKGLKVEISKKNLLYLEDRNNMLYSYDILNVLKSDLVERFYVDATTECPDVKDFITLAGETGSIPAYAYLGDVTESVTGDKKAQKFEDSYLELLFDVIDRLGFKAVTYMPTRNSREQLKHIRRLCEKYGFFQICGEDINSPRQSFVCEILRQRQLQKMVDSSWALIGHEKMAQKDLDYGLFSEEMIKKYPSLDERIDIFKKAGKKDQDQ